MLHWHRFADFAGADKNTASLYCAACACLYFKDYVESKGKHANLRKLCVFALFASIASFTDAVSQKLIDVQMSLTVFKEIEGKSILAVCRFARINTNDCKAKICFIRANI